MLKGWKTVIVSFLIAGFGAVQGFDWATIVTDPQVAGWIGVGIGALMFVLRAVTNSPIGKPEQ